jgi:hypothetical protein
MNRCLAEFPNLAENRDIARVLAHLCEKLRG